MRRAFIVAALLVSVAGCSAPAKSSMAAMPGMDDMAGMSAAPTAAPLPEARPTGDGLSSSINGYSFTPTARTVPAGVPTSFDFQIGGPAGHPVTRYQPYLSQLMLFDVIRSDLTGYQHFDPAMRQDGTWSVQLAALSPGSYRAYVTFAAPDASAGKPLVYTLSQPFTVPGQPVAAALPSQSGGPKVTLTGHPKSGITTPLTLGFNSINYFQRYLDGYAHIIAIHAGDLAFAHLTPADRVPGRQELTTQALFPASGTWRLFVQLQTNGPLQTVPFTIDVS